jgi:hypothetical protein
MDGECAIQKARERREPIWMTLADLMALVLGSALAISLPQMHLPTDRITIGNVPMGGWVAWAFVIGEIAMKVGLALILGITDGKGARIVFDPVGGPTVEKLTKAMAGFGILFIYGALSTEPSPLPLFDVLVKHLTIRGYTLMEITTDPARLERGKRFINEGLAEGSLKPIIAKTFPLEKIVEAHRFMESNQQIGKIVVTV